jgi:hypothetical protein
MEGEARVYSVRMPQITRTQNLSVIHVATKLPSLVRFLQRKVIISQRRVLNNISPENVSETCNYL